MDSKKQRKLLLLNIILVAFIYSIVILVVESTAGYNDLGEGIDLFSSVYRHVLNNYVKEKTPTEISKDAINGILGSLDPYSSFLEKKDFGQFMEDTKGEFGGLGIEISTPGDYPQIMSYPFEDTPAEKMGLRAGDLIVEIEGKSTHKMPLTEVVGMLRGKVGTDVKIKIKRGGIKDLLEFTITRGKIPLHSVTYAGEIEQGIGYIKLRGFNQNASQEMNEAIQKLQEMNVEGVILDLRGNPGGLLEAAQQVSNKFLAKDKLIVFTMDRSNKKIEYRATAPAKLPAKPLVVLVDRASASASEIVAGAIQDHDRGVLIGETTFGKGLVQTVYYDLPDGNGLKLTTSLYYTPSHRCINKDRSADEMFEEPELMELSEEAPEDTLNKRDKYYTINKERIVYGDGGITPDIIIKYKRIGNIVSQLIYQNTFFDFAVKYAKEHDFEVDFPITDEMIEEFKTYIDDEDVFKYSIPGKAYYESFKKRVSIEEYNGDILARIDELEKALINKRNEDFEANREVIKRYLKREIAVAKLGSSQRAIASKDWDIQLQKAIEILKNSEVYDSILAPGAETGIEN